MANAGDLHGCGLAAEHQQPVAVGVARQVEQDVDTIASNHFRHVVVGHADGAPPARGGFAEACAHVVGAQGAVVAMDFEIVAVVIEDQLGETGAGRVVVEIGRYIPDAQTAFGIAAVGVGLYRCGQRCDEAVVPALALGLLLGLGHGHVHVLGEDDIGVQAGRGGVEVVGAPVGIGGLIDAAHLSQNLAAVAVGGGKGGVYRDGFIEAGDSLIHASDEAQHHARLAMGSGVVRIDGKRLAQAGKAVVDAVQSLQRDRPVVVIGRVVGVAGNRLRDQVECCLVLAEMKGDQAE